VVDAIDTQGPRPDFIVLPDKVAAGAESLELSLQWSRRLRGVAPLSLVVQDGMEPPEVMNALVDTAATVLFVGGSLEWKLDTAPQWVRLAHSYGRRCHVGRCGTMVRVRWAREIHADSVDSTTPLWSDAHLERFVRALGQPFQPTADLFRATKKPPAKRSFGAL
jgi:hypothetical protein